MDKKITIVPRVDNEGNIILKLTAGQFEEINKGLIALNKRRVIHRNTMAKQRGATETKSSKPELVFSYPVAESSILIPKNTAYNALPQYERKTPSPPLMTLNVITPVNIS